MKWLLLPIMLYSSIGWTSEPQPSPRVIKAIYKAARTFKVDPQLMLNIAYIESRYKSDAVRLNTNNSIDYGVFQVNTVHWNGICKAFDVFTVEGNAMCAAKLLFLIKKTHEHTDKQWKGRYHSKTPSKKLKYFTLLLNRSIAMAKE